VTSVARHVPEVGVWVVDDRRSVAKAMVVARPVDVHGQSLAGARIDCTHPLARTTPPGREYVSVFGDVDVVLPAWSSGPSSLDVTLSAPGRQPLTRTVAIPQYADLPIRLGDVYLSAQPVAVAGQVRVADLERAPIADAFVTCAVVPGLIPLTLRQPLVVDHPVAGTQLQAATVSVLAPATTTPTGAASGAHVVRVANTTAMTPGKFLRFTPGPRAQYVVIKELIGDVVVLTAPLAAAVRPGAAVQVVGLTATGPNRQLTRPALAGDGIVTLDGNLGGDVVRITGPTTLELRAIGGRSDPDGFFVLPGFRGLAEIAINATASGLASSQSPIVLHIDETRTNQVVIDVTP
jgi:hypothetical protein